MNTDQRPNPLYTLCRRGGMVLFCLLVAAVTGLSATGWADSVYLITGTEDEGAIILDPKQKTAPELTSKLVYVSSGAKGYDLTLQEGTSVTVRHEGSAVTVQSHKESVSSILSRLHVNPSPLEMVGVTVSESGVDLNVASDLTYYEYVTENVSFSTQRVANPDMLEGEEKVVQKGADGVRSSVYEVVWSNGAQLSRQFVEELSTTAVDQIVEYGTKSKAKPAASQNKDPDALLTEHGETAEILRRPHHDRHGLYHGTRRRGHPDRQRHRGPRGLRGRGQERHPPGHPDVYRGQRKRGLRTGRGRGHGGQGQQDRPLLRHLRGVHPVWQANLYRLYSPVTVSRAPGCFGRGPFPFLGALCESITNRGRKLPVNCQFCQLRSGPETDTIGMTYPAGGRRVPFPEFSSE